MDTLDGIRRVFTKHCDKAGLYEHIMSRPTKQSRYIYTYQSRCALFNRPLRRLLIKRLLKEAAKVSVLAFLL